MSSFTIAKKEYIKAAGLVAGIAEAYNRGPHNFWIYNYETGRNSTPEDYYKAFEKFYNMNALSVAEQYDEAPETDTEDYKTDFNLYRNKGHQAITDPGNLKKYMMELRNFFHSAIYQTEKDSYMWQMQLYFDRILDQLIGVIFPGDWESWGTLEI